MVEIESYKLTINKHSKQTINHYCINLSYNVCFRGPVTETVVSVVYHSPPQSQKHIKWLLFWGYC